MRGAASGITVLRRMRNSSHYFCLFAILTLGACSVTEDVRDNPLDPKYGSTGSGTAAAKPDLVISAFNTAGSYTSNTPYNFSVTVKNQGSAAAGSFTVAVWTGASSSSLNYALAYTTSFAGKVIVNSLAAGASTTVTISFTPIFTAHGLIGAYADTTETVSEGSEANNYKLNNVVIN